MSVGLPEAPGARLCGREQAPIEMTKAREIPGFFCVPSRIEVHSPPSIHAGSVVSNFEQL